MPIPFWKPVAAPSGALQAARQPLLAANPLSQLFLQWLNPLLKIGYSRPVQIEGEFTDWMQVLMMQTSGLSRSTWNVPRYVSNGPSQKYEKLTLQTADVMEAHLNSRFPPSRRLWKYRSPSNQVENPLSSHLSEAPSCKVPQGRAEYEERLFDANEAEIADLRTAEMAEDLTLNPINSRSECRDSQATVVSRIPIASKTNSRGPTTGGLAETDDQIVQQFGKRKGRQVAMGQSAVEDGRFYDMSFTRVLFTTIKKQWFICLFLNSLACKSDHLCTIRH